MQDAYQHGHISMSWGLRYWLFMFQVGSPLSVPFSLPFLSLSPGQSHPLPSLNSKPGDVTFQTVLT